MTVIAFKDGIMVADSGAFLGGIVSPCPFPKITRSPCGQLFALAGSLGDAWRLRQWALAGPYESDEPKFTETGDNSPFILRADRDGSLWFAKGGLLFNPIPVPTAIGANTPAIFCEAAMKAGLSAEAALRLAIQHCENVWGEVQVEPIE